MPPTPAPPAATGCWPIGGAELNSPEEQKWLPILEGFEAGAWLYWVCNDSITVVCLPEIHRDEQNRPHRDDGPAFVSLDLKYWFWKGILVDRWIIEQPEEITVAKIEAEKNAEIKRVMVERYGEDKYIVDSGLEPVACDDFGELYRKDFAGDSPLVYVRVMNSTPETDGSTKPYFLSVNPQHYDGAAGKIPHAAIASTWRTTKDGKELFFKRYEDYRPGIQT